MPIVVDEPESDRVRAIRGEDRSIAVWWSCIVECSGAIARLERMNELTPLQVDDARERLSRLAAQWYEIEPSEECRERAVLLVRRYPLSAADALQLAAAVAWCGGRPNGDELCTLDGRLAAAARREGFTLPLG